MDTLFKKEEIQESNIRGIEAKLDQILTLATNDAKKGKIMLS